MKINPVLPKNAIKNYKNKINSESKLRAEDPDFMPVYENSSWCCLSANLPEDVRGDKKLSIAPGYTEIIDCGVELLQKPGCAYEARAIGDLAARGIFARLCDMPFNEDYAKIKIILSNFGKTIITLSHKDKIAEISARPVWHFDIGEPN